MMESMRWIAGLLLLLLVGFAWIYIASGRAAPPGLVINQPSGRFIGQTGALAVYAEAPKPAFSARTITREQNGRTIPIFALGDSSQAQVLTPVDRNHVRINQPIGKANIPQLQQGPARLIVTAARPSLFNLHTLTS